jgi:hypothetical protein
VGSKERGRRGEGGEGKASVTLEVFLEKGHSILDRGSGRTPCSNGKEKDRGSGANLGLGRWCFMPLPYRLMAKGEQ